tara:strand:- start:84 stop:533 length:450 start_codon:yes stop_codon:yes gene_type:complete
MEVILLENIASLGELGEKVQVRSGYGRNFLIPKGKAVPASEENISLFEVRRAELEKTASELVAKTEARASSIESLETIEIQANAGEEGKLFGSIGTRDIAEAVSSAGCEVDKSEIRLPDGALRQLGEYQISIQLHGNASATVNVSIVQE